MTPARDAPERASDALLLDRVCGRRAGKDVALGNAALLARLGIGDALRLRRAVA